MPTRQTKPRALAPRTFEWPDGSITGTGEMASIDAACKRIVERALADGTLPVGLRPGDVVGPRPTDLGADGPGAVDASDGCTSPRSRAGA